MNGSPIFSNYAQYRKIAMRALLLSAICVGLMLWGPWGIQAAAESEPDFVLATTSELPSELPSEAAVKPTSEPISELPFEPTVKPTSEPAQIVRDYTYDAAREVPTIEQRITDAEGTVYLLKEISDPILREDAAAERHFTATVQRPVTPEQESQGSGALQSLLAEALSLDTGEYAGILRFQSLTTEPVYRSAEEQIERTIVYPDLASEDVLQLPEQETFTVASDESLEATVTQELKRVAVTWRTTGFDEDGRPALHEASVIFRGIQRQLVIDYYVVTATYAGTIPAKSREETVSATYEAEPVPVPEALPTIVPLTVSEIAVPLAAPAPASSPFPFVIAGTVAVVTLLALLFCLYFFFYHNARLVRVSATGHRRTLIRRRLRIEKGEASFRIAPSFKPYDEDATHLIILGRSLAQRQGHLTLLWGECLLLRVALRREIDVTEELLRSLGGGVDVLIWENAQLVQELLGEEA